jgi:hypothetical protein
MTDRLLRDLDELTRAASFMRCLTLAPVQRALRTAAAAGERAGESPFLADPEPWVDGTAADLSG